VAGRRVAPDFSTLSGDGSRARVQQCLALVDDLDAARRAPGRTITVSKHVMYEVVGLGYTPPTTKEEAARLVAQLEARVDRLLQLESE
jgi:hypothetical protein